MRFLKLERLLVVAFVAAIGSMSLVAAPAFGQALTIESVLSAPFPLGLTASPFDGRVAWVSKERGVRNIRIAERKPDGSFTTRAITKYSADDGYELDAIAWADNGSTILFTGGGSLEGGGPANPGDRPEGPLVKEIFALRIGNAEARNFGAGDSPVASPKGDRFAFTRGGQIWSARLGSTNAATQLINDRGTAGGLTFSPDGTKLAFVSTRRDRQALLGIYDFATSKITWMAPSTDRDASPVWAADGRRIAWVRTPASLARYGFLRPRAGTPWSIWTGDVATGDAKAVWRADPGRGSNFKGVEDGSALFWSADNRLVFPWEKTGWIRLYSIPVGGGAPAALTPDNAEVFAATLDSTGTRLVFSSNSTDDDHRHLWQVAAAGGTPHMLTQGDSIEDLPAVAKDGGVYALHGTAREPLAPVAVNADGAIRPIYVNAATAAFPRRALVEPQRVVYKSPDGIQVHGQLFLPAGQARGKRPAILFFHGGPQRQMLLGWHPMGAYAHFYAMNQYLASQGYVVLSVNFRGGTGYGLDFRQPLEFAEGGASEVRDIAGAAAYLKSRQDVDDKRLGVYGLSYGGVMTGYSLARFPDVFAAGVDMAGVHNWKSFLAGRNGGEGGDMDELAYKSSPIFTAKDWRAPVLFIHGDDDRSVPFVQTTEMVAALREAGKVEPELHIMPNELHNFMRHDTWLEAFGATGEFFRRNLMNKGTR